MREKIGKKGIKKRLFSVVLALALVVSLLPVSGTTAYAAGTGTTTYTNLGQVIDGEDTDDVCFYFNWQWHEKEDSSCNHEDYITWALEQRTNDRENPVADLSWNTDRLILKIKGSMTTIYVKDTHTPWESNASICMYCGKAISGGSGGGTGPDTSSWPDNKAHSGCMHSSSDHFYATGVTYGDQGSEKAEGRNFGISTEDYYEGSTNDIGVSSFGEEISAGWYYQKSSDWKYYKCSAPHSHNSSAYGSNATTHWTKCSDDELNNGTPVNHTWVNGKCSICQYECTHNSATSGTCAICGKSLGTPTPDPNPIIPTPTPVPTPAPAPVPAPVVEPEMKTVNVAGATLNTWEDIAISVPTLTAESIHKANESSDALLHVNIVGKEDKTVPVAAVQAVAKSSIDGLHVFIGESDAITFLSDKDYTNYTGISFKHEDVVTDDSRTIDFTSKGAINATVLFHTLIAPNVKAKVYIVLEDGEKEIATLTSNEDGGFCFEITELAKYIIRY